MKRNIKIKLFYYVQYEVAMLVCVLNNENPKRGQTKCEFPPPSYKWLYFLDNLWRTLNILWETQDYNIIVCKTGNWWLRRDWIRMGVDARSRMHVFPISLPIDKAWQRKYKYSYSIVCSTNRCGPSHLQPGPVLRWIAPRAANSFGAPPPEYYLN